MKNFFRGSLFQNHKNSFLWGQYKKYLEGFRSLKHKKFSLGGLFFIFWAGMKSAVFYFWKYKKSLLLRKYKNFFDIWVRRFHFLKYQEFFFGLDFFISLSSDLNVSQVALNTTMTSSRYLFKASWRRLRRRKIFTLKTSSRSLEDMSWRRLEDQQMFAGYEKCNISSSIKNFNFYTPLYNNNWHKYNKKATTNELARITVHGQLSKRLQKFRMSTEYMICPRTKDVWQNQCKMKHIFMRNFNSKSF